VAYLRILILIAVGALFGCGWQGFQFPRVTKGQNKLGVVRFPEAWTASGSDSHKISLYDPEGLTARRAGANSSQEYLIFAMKGQIIRNPDNPDEGVKSIESDNRYAVSLDGRFQVRPATAEEWNRAEQLPNTRQRIRMNQPNSPASKNVADEGLSYRGRIFGKTGIFWADPAALASPGGLWLAVFSYSSKESPRTSWSPLDGGTPQEPGPGEMFVDVYDTSSGEKILAGRAPYKNSPSILFNEALWVADKYFALPIDPVKPFDYRGQACFLGILPTR